MKEDLYKGNRDEKGRFIKGVPSNLCADERAKIIQKVIETKKKSPGYIGDLKTKYPYIYNSWRSINYTEKSLSKNSCIIIHIVNRVAKPIKRKEVRS